MRLNLDHPARTTRDYEGPSVAPRVQAALDAAMNNVEEDIDIDALAISNTFQVKGTRKEKSKKARRPKSSRSGGNGGVNGNGGGMNGSSTGSSGRKVNYPESRGLVPK